MIRGTIKRLLAVILTAAVTLTCTPVSIYADEQVVTDELNTDDFDNDDSFSDDSMLLTDDISDITDTDEVSSEALADEILPLGSDDEEGMGEALLSDDSVYPDEDTGYDYIEGGEMPEVDPLEVENPSTRTLSQVMSGNDRLGDEILPSSYISPDLPPLRSQSPYGACWTFSSMALAEMNLIKKGTVSADKIDLSELHLAYFTYNTVADPLGGTEKDKNEILTGDFMRRGGNRNYSKNILASWTGAADEAKAPYSTAEYALIHGLESELAYDDQAHLTDYYDVDLSDTSEDFTSKSFKEDGIKAVKQLVYDYGAAGISYYSTSSLHDSVHNSYYDPTIRATNHAVTIVGWDDNFSKDDFKGSEKPEKNGAWLIRNTHKSTNGGDYEHNKNYQGYFWLSYYSMSNGDKANAFIFDTAGNYDNNYQYDGAMSDDKMGVTKGDSLAVANVFTTTINDKDSDSLLKAVSFATPTAEVSYEINICKDIIYGGSPSDGVIAEEATTTGTTVYAGYHTVTLASPVRLKSGERFAVIVRLKKTETDRPKITAEYTINTSDWLRTNADIAEKQSYYYNGSKWVDYKTSDKRGKRGNFRIKAFTDDLPDPTIPPKKAMEFDFEDGELEKNFPSYDYTGSEIKPKLAVRYEGRRLVEGTDYTLSYKNNINAYTPASSSAVGSADPRVTVKFKGDFSGKKVLNFRIRPVSFESLGEDPDVFIRPVSALVKYKRGDYVRQELKPVIFYKGRKLKEKRDYTLEYHDTREGAYAEESRDDSPWKIRVKAAGGNFTGSIEVDEILRDNSNGGSYVPLNGKGVKFTAGSSKTEFMNDFPVYTGTFTDPETGKRAELVRDKDYTVDIEDGGRPGTAYAVITALPEGRFVGGLVKKFRITKADISDRITVSINNVSYEKGGVRPAVSVNYIFKDLKVPLTEGRDYKVVYGNNKAAADSHDGKAPYISVVGLGNYKGRSVHNFTIEKKDIGLLDRPGNLFTAGIKSADLKDISKKAPVILKDTNGRQLKNGTDYRITGYIPTGSNAVPVPGDEIILTIEGQDNYFGTITVKCPLVEGRELKKASLRCYNDEKDRESGTAASGFFYTGNEICPPVIDITMGKGEDAAVLKQDVDYKIAGYLNNINKGTGYVVIRGIGDYAGLKVLKFKILSRRMDKQHNQ